MSSTPSEFSIYYLEHLLRRTVEMAGRKKKKPLSAALLCVFGTFESVRSEALMVSLSGAWSVFLSVSRSLRVATAARGQ